MEPVSNADKLAEIRQRNVERRKCSKEYAETFSFGIISRHKFLTEKAMEDIDDLLSELDCERSSHNEHAAELCRLEDENRELRKTKEKLFVLSDERQARAMEYYQELQSIQQERDKLIEGFTKMAESEDEWYVGSMTMQGYAVRLLWEIGVGEERT